MYDGRIIRRWNVDPVTYPWHGGYTVFNGNPILYADPLGLFGTKGEAKAYKKENNIKGKIQFNKTDNEWNINDKKNGFSYTKAEDSEFGRDLDIGDGKEDGVVKCVMISAERIEKPWWYDYSAAHKVKNYKPLYSKEEMKTAEKWSIGITTSLLGGYGIWANGLKIAMGAFLARAGADVAIQTTANYVSDGKGLSNALSNVNLIETFMIGMNVPLGYVGIAAGFHNISFDKRKSIFNGKITIEQGTYSAGVGIGLGVIGNKTTSFLKNKQARYWFGVQPGEVPKLFPILNGLGFDIATEIIQNKAEE